jgi:hypothetical protein
MGSTVCVVLLTVARILVFLLSVSVPVWRAIRNFEMALDTS